MQVRLAQGVSATYCELMHIGEIILWIIGSVVIIWVVGWVLSRGLPQLVRKTSIWLSGVNDRLPLSMRPIEHALLCILLGSLTLLIANFPNWPLWRFIVAQDAQAELHPGTLIAASAALLALLQFAANQLRNLEKDAISDNQFMGVNLDTYLAQRSRIVRVLGLPIFHIAICALFIMPLVWFSVPETIDSDSFGSYVPSVIASPQLLAIAFWCASFGTVSGILLLNVLGTLRNSTLGFRSPVGIKHRVRLELRQVVKSVYTEFFRLDDKDAATEIFLWTSKILGNVSDLPADQRVDYVNETLGALKYKALRERSQDKFVKVQKNLQLFDANTVATLKQKPSRLRQRRLSRAKYILRIRAELAYGRTWAILEYLQNHELSQHLQTRLVDICLEEARQFDNDCGRFPWFNWTEGYVSERIEDGHLNAEAYKILTRPLDQISDIDRGFRPYSAGREEAPRVVLLPAFVYRSLARGLLPSYGGSRLSVTLVEKIVSAANGLQDRRTRGYAVREVMKAIIDCTIVSRRQDEAIEINQLEKMLSQNGRYASSLTRGTKGRKSLDTFIGECAFSALVVESHLEERQRSALLRVVSGEQALGALLYLLFYGVRSYSALQAADLRPFQLGLRDFRLGAGANNQSARVAVARFIQSSNINHFVGAREVEWLFDALEEPLAVDVCVNFLEQRDQSRFYDFGLLQLLQWRVVAAEALYVPYSSFKSIAPSHNKQLIQAKPQVQDFADDWRAVDPVTANRIEQLLLQFP